MVSKQETISINLLLLVRITAVALLILFFLPWFTSTIGPASGASTVVDLVSHFTQDEITGRLISLAVIAGWGFIPIGSLVILLLSYSHALGVPILSIITGVLGIIPFIIILIMHFDVSRWYFPMTLTALCLLTLIVIGATLLWKSAKKTPSSAF